MRGAVTLPEGGEVLFGTIAEAGGLRAMEEAEGSEAPEVEEGLLVVAMGPDVGEVGAAVGDLGLIGCEFELVAVEEEEEEEAVEDTEEVSELASVLDFLSSDFLMDPIAV